MARLNMNTDTLDSASKLSGRVVDSLENGCRYMDSVIIGKIEAFENSLDWDERSQAAAILDMLESEFKQYAARRDAARQQVSDYHEQFCGRLAQLTEFINMYNSLDLSAGGGVSVGCGGAYSSIRTSGMEAHHMPAQSTLPDNIRTRAPSISMYPEDHAQTSSFGYSNQSIRYRQTQQELINAGHYSQAMRMDIDNVRSLFPGRYDRAIGQMLDYTPDYIANTDI